METIKTFEICFPTVASVHMQSPDPVILGLYICHCLASHPILQVRAVADL